ncbi:MAG: cytochrome c biogenesis protein CcsA, partial [Nitrospiria bacterium]
MLHLVFFNIMKGGCLAMAGLTFFPSLRRFQSRLIGLTLGMGIGALALRGWESWRLGFGHFPSANLFEAVALLVVYAVFLLLWVGRTDVRFIKITTLGLILPLCALLSYAEATGAAELRPLAPSLNSIWIQIHVPVTILGYATFLLAGVAGGISLWSLRRDDASDAAYRAIIIRMLKIGFPLFTLGIVFGAIWAFTVWGSFWAWDPKETWALITWLWYAAGFHIATARPRLFLLWVVLGAPLTLFAFIGVNYLFSGQ